MKYLSDYIQDEQSALFKKLWIFFAFWDKQFNEQKKDWVEYVSLGAGMICPKENADKFRPLHWKIVNKGIKQDVKENWIDRIIERELSNHEAYYTYEIGTTIEALDWYDITRDDVQRVFKLTQDKHND